MSIEAHSEELTNLIENRVADLVEEAQNCLCEGAKVVHPQRENIENRAAQLASRISIIHVELEDFICQLDDISSHFPPWHP